MLPSRIKSKYSKKAQVQATNKKSDYLEKAAVIEKLITQLLIEMVDDDVEGEGVEQASILLRHALKKLQVVLRFLR